MRLFPTESAEASRKADFSPHCDVRRARWHCCRSRALSQAVEYTAARKAGRGLAAMTTCFLEIPGNMVADESRGGSGGMGMPLGFVIGLGKLVDPAARGSLRIYFCSVRSAPAGFQADHRT